MAPVFVAPVASDLHGLPTIGMYLACEIFSAATARAVPIIYHLPDNRVHLSIMLKISALGADWPTRSPAPSRWVVQSMAEKWKADIFLRVPFIGLRRLALASAQDVGVKFRRLWLVNSAFMEGGAEYFRVPIVVKEKGPLGIVIYQKESDNSLRFGEVKGVAINASVEMLRFQDVLVPEGGAHGKGYTTIQQFSDDSKIRPFRFDAIANC